MLPFTLRDSILIHAPIDRCFLLSTSLAVVEDELGMKPVGSRATNGVLSRTAGHVQAGNTVRWQGWKFGLPQFHVSLIVPETFDPPRFFQDRMLAGRFHTFEHDHSFEQKSGDTLLQDELRFIMPFGILGMFVGGAVMVPHIRGLMRRRFARLKRLAESEDWRQYVDE